MRDPQDKTFTFHGHPVCPLGYETRHVETADGITLTLFRSRPWVADPDSPPVLLVPGLGSNRFTFGLTRTHGLPHLLAGAGRDVWLAELRGSKSARVPPGAKARVDLSHKLTHDLPALVAEVRTATGADTLDLIGHSLGGLLALLHSASDPGVRKVVTVSTPGRLDGLAGFLEKTPLMPAVARGLEKMVGTFERLAVSPLARLGGPVPHLAMGRHFLPGAVDAATRRRYLDHAVEDVPGPELAQLVRWAATGELSDAIGRPLDEALAQVRVPTLCVISTRDKVVPEDNAVHLYARLGSPAKTLLKVDRGARASRDYAHADILLAPSATRDVLEPIADWLAADPVDARFIAPPSSVDARSIAPTGSVDARFIAPELRTKRTA